MNRMSYIRGHVEGVRKMIDADAYCPEVILQNLAIIRAVKRANELLLASHLETCARSTMRNGDDRARAKVEREIVEIVRHSC